MRILFSLISVIGLMWATMFPQGSASAAVSLALEIITWNVVGLDSNNVNVGPNKFPLGARVCNTGATDATNVVVDFHWDDANDDYTGDPYINLRSGSLSVISLSSVPAGTCKDAYFEVAVTRNSNAYKKTRDYFITVDSDQTGLISTPKPREIFVEYLISQNRNATDGISYGTNESSLTSVGAGGSLNLQVGQTYFIKLDAHTATQGYNQLESFINFPNTIFQVLEVKTNYTANTSVYVANTNDMLYADACLWDNVVTSPTYRSCIGSDGKSGGTVTTTYKVKILSGAGTTQPLNTLLYDFSGSSYHYNSDFSSAARFAVISSPLSLSKTFNPTTITTSGGTSTLTLAIGNTSTSQTDNVSISDPLPSGMVVASTPTPTLSAGCVGGTFAPVAGDTTLTYTGSVAGSGTCTLTVQVTASADGSYTNTAELFWNNNTTGITAKDSLAVNTSTQACGAPQVLASWTFPNNVGSITTINADTGSVLSGVGTKKGLGSVSQTVTGVTTFAWQMNGFSTDGAGYKFQIPNGNTYANLSVKISYKAGSSSWTTPALKIDSSINDSTYTNIYSNNTWSQSAWTTTSSVNASQTCSTAGCSTYFMVYATGANANSSTLEIDNIEVTGCELNTLEKARLSKSFSSDPIKVGGTSTLTFTLTNPNSTSNLTSVAFTDILPSGMKVALTPNASTTCTNATWSPAAGDTTLTFSGGTILQGSPGTCTAQVDVTVLTSGTFTNTSGYISSSEAGLNTNPYNDAKPGQGRDTLTVTAGPPQIMKSFSPNPIPVNGKSILTFTISNPNLDSSLTNVSFTDNFPAEITATTSPTTTCTGGVLTTSTASVIEMTGATLTAGATCIVSVEITSATVNLTGHANSVTVSSTEGGTGNTSTDNLIVNPVAPELTLLKEISTSPTGPWSNVVNVSAGTNVYYRFTIENTGDVPLSPVWVTDNTLSQVSTCSWPATLPVASATADPSASCVVGPVTAQTGSHVNTATAKGTHGGTTYSSSTSSATYATTSLILDKSGSPTIFSTVGQQLTYTYTITNNGTAAVTGPVAVTDSHTTAVCDQPGSLAVGATVTCTAIYTITAQDLAIGSVTNSASGSIGSTYTNADKATSLADKPDMVVSKTNTITGGQAIQGTQFFWTLTIANNGGATGTFINTRIISDTLPSGPTYDASATVNLSGLTNNTGTVTCSIVGQNLSCSANGTVTIEAGENFTVQLGVTPQTTDTLTNLVTVDPDNALTESNEGNNNGSNIIAVSAPLPDLTISKTNDVSDVAAKDTKFNWTLTLNNSGEATASFSNGNTILTDMLPTGPIYDATPAVATTGVTGMVDCSIIGQLLSCSANGGVSIPAGAIITVEVGVTSSATGTLNNTATVNPDFVFAESNTSNNTSADTVTVYAPPTVSKSFSPSTIYTGGTSVLTLTLTNPAGNAGALTSVRVEDDFGSTGILLENTTFTFSPNGCGTVTKPDTSASAANDTAVLFSASSLAAGASCQVQINVTNSMTGTVTNTTKVPTALVEGAITLTGLTANANLTVNTKPDLSVTKTNNAASPAYAGVMFTWTITVSNSGNTSAFANGDVVLRDPLPSGATYANLSGPTPAISNLTCAIDGSNILTCTAGAGGVTLAVGDSFDVSIEVTPTGAGILSNTATVDTGSKVDESHEGNNTSTNDVTAIANPDLTVSKTNNAASPAYVNAMFKWIMTVSNSGSAATFANGDVVLRDPLPSGATYANLTGPSPAVTNLTCAIDGSNVLTCTAGAGDVTLAADSSFDVSIEVTPTSAGALNNTATVDPDTKVSEGNESNNTGTDSLTAIVRPDLAVSKTNDAASPAYNAVMFTWTMTVSTSGSDATFANGDVVLRDLLPSGATYANLNGPSPAVPNLTCAIDGSNGITCTAGAGGVTLSAGSSFDVSIDVTPTGTGILNNTAAVDPDSKVIESAEDNNTGSNNVTVEGKPDLTVIKTNNALNPVFANTAFTWTMTVSNSGNTATFANGDVVLRDPLPSGATYANLTGPTPAVTNLGCAIDGSNVITCTAGASGVILSAGDSFAVTIDATPTGSGTLSNTATVDSGSVVDENNEGNNTGSDDVNVAIEANLAITKTNNASAVESGKTTSYTITVINNGPDSADGAIFKDPSAAGLTATSVTCGNASGGAACPAVADTTVALMQGAGIVIPILPNGGTVTFTVDVTVTAVAGGTITNTATIDVPSGVSDPNSNDSSASDTDPANAPNVFDPPSVLKTFSGNGTPELEFRMVWINNGNITAIDVQVTDEIPAGTTYVAGSLNCSPQGTSTTRGANASSPLNTALSSCAFDGTANGGRGRIQWQGNIAPDHVAATDPNAEILAANEVIITFRVTVDANVNQVFNIASSRTDIDNDGDFDEEQAFGGSLINSNQVVWSRGNTAGIPDPEDFPDELPKTGFAPDIVTTLPKQSAEKAYLNTDVWLEIPRLGVKMPIVGVPLVDGDWELSWLWNEAGWLEGTAFPGWRGNSVLTSHVTLPNGQKGPFATLPDLRWGDRILIHAFGTVYTYEVRQNKVVSATDANVLQHEEKAWLTLLTCTSYNETTNAYDRRVAVKAVLVHVAKDKGSNGRHVR